MADISGTIQKLPNSSNLVGGFSRVETFVWEPVADGTSGTGTHNIIAIPAGEVLLFAIGIVITSFTDAGGTADVVFQIGSDTLVGAAGIEKEQLVAGDVVTIGFGGDLAVTSKAQYAVAADTLDAVVANEAFTAGKMYIKCFFDDISAYQTQVNS